MTKQFIAIAAAAGFLAGVSTAALAQAQTTPGHEMQEKGSVKGSPGASGYAPGHQMQEKGSVKGTTGASGYAPGHNKDTSGSSVKGNADVDVKAGDTKAGASGSVNVK
jgi:hypothetical protein